MASRRLSGTIAAATSGSVVEKSGRAAPERVMDARI